MIVSVRASKVHDKGGILITGFDGSKIGIELAKTLRSKGFTVFAGCYNSNHLLDHKDLGCIVVKIDVTNEQSITRAAQVIRCKLGHDPLVGIVHCAGTAIVGPIEHLSKQDLENVYAVNTIGPCLVTSSLLDLLKESEGRVVFMSSVLGWTGSPLNSSFGSSKLALEAIADSLRIEVGRWNVSVSIMELGFTEKLKKETQNLYNTKSLWNYKGLITSMNEILKNTRPLSTGYSTRALMHALFSKYPKTRYFVGWDARATWLLRSLLPDRVLDAMYTSSLDEFYSKQGDEMCDGMPMESDIAIAGVESKVRLRVNNQF